MKLPVAMAAVLVTAASASAAPFHLERLVAEGDVLPGLDEPVTIIGTPSINSSGEWAIPVSQLWPSDPKFKGGVLGNDGFRILPGIDPDGSISPIRNSYDTVTISDEGQLASIVRRSGAPSQLWLADQFVTVASGGGPLRGITLFPGDLLVHSDGAGKTFVSEPDKPRAWTTAIVHGDGVFTPVGPVAYAPSTPLAYGRSVLGQQAWVGTFVTGADGNPDAVTRGIVVDDDFIFVESQQSQISGFEYQGGSAVRWNASNELFYSASLRSSGDGPLDFASGIFNESGEPLASSRTSYSGLDEFGEWGISTSNFDVDSGGNILWVAQSGELPGPDHPFPFFRTALMYNDTLITKMGDVLDDGMIVAGVRGGFSLSDDGSWAITPLRVFDPDSEQLSIAVYRFAIPAPSTAMLLAALGLTGVRRRR